MKNKKHAKSNYKTKPKIDEIALVLIVAVIAIIISFYHKSSSTTQEQRLLTAIILEDKTLLFTNDGIINENELMRIKNMDYEQLKKSLNIKEDFCIYLEDENGRIIVAKGSEKFNRDGMHCQ